MVKNKHFGGPAKPFRRFLVSVMPFVVLKWTTFVISWCLNKRSFLAFYKFYNKCVKLQLETKQDNFGGPPQDLWGPPEGRGPPVE